MFKICGICGKVFEVDEKNINERRRKYCGEECAKTAQAERIHAYSVTHRKPGKNAICVVCGKPFMTNRPHKVTCGPDCQYERNKMLARENAHRKTKKYLAEQAAIPKLEPPPRKQKKVESIEEVQRKARELGMSYGQYMAMVQCQRMQEERGKHGRAKDVCKNNNR